MNTAALADPETVKAFAALIELLANPQKHKAAVEELKKLVHESQTALVNAQKAQAAADIQMQGVVRLKATAEDVKARNTRDLADIAVRKKQLDDHAEVLSKRQADLEENQRRSDEEFDGREKKMVERERQTQLRSEVTDAARTALEEREKALKVRETDIAAAEARLREIMGLTRNYALEAETGRPFTRMGG